MASNGEPSDIKLGAEIDRAAAIGFAAAAAFAILVYGPGVWAPGILDALLAGEGVSIDRAYLRLAANVGCGALIVAVSAWAIAGLKRAKS